MKRRDVLAVVSVLGLEGAFGSTAFAGAGPRPTPVGGIWSLFFDFWGALPQDVRDEIKHVAYEAAAELAREAVVAFFAAREEHQGWHIGGGPGAHIQIRITRAPAGHLVLESHLKNIDGGSQPHLTLSGTAPHHRHAGVRAHIREIARRSHVYLRTRNV